MGFTLVLGWWGFFALLFRNPYAIAVNVWALFAPPFGAREFGAMNVSDIRRAAADEEAPDERLADVYMRMPEWIESLSDEDVRRVLASVDYYGILEVASTASHGEIRTAWRQQVKANHPDRAGDHAHTRMVAINAAWEVLGDERLRHAFDHRDELLTFLEATDAFDSAEEDTVDDESPLAFACVDCQLGFTTFEDAADHVDDVHPDRAYQDVLVSLVDEDDSNDGSDADSEPRRWRCKTCGATFQDYDKAVSHADGAHPDRVSVDPRTAVDSL